MRSANIRQSLSSSAPLLNKISGASEMSNAAGDEFSRTFYPFLHEGDRKSPGLTEELRFSLLGKVRERDEVRASLLSDNSDAILAASLRMAKAFHRAGKLLVCGNGGSATDAQHIAVEF